MKFRLLLLDANVVIYLHELGLWDKFTDSCDVTLTRTVVDEVKYYSAEEGIQYRIDLEPDVRDGRINCVDVPVDRVQKFIESFGPSYIDRLDPGESESLAYLFNSSEEWLICSADEIVFRALGLLQRVEQGISLEEILQKTGLVRSDLAGRYSKQFRLNVTKKGQIDHITGFDPN